MKAIEERPGMFLQKDCIFQLRAFIRGFCLAKNVSPRNNNDFLCDDHQLLNKFDDSVRKKYRVNADHISIEETLFDAVGDRAFFKYIELWNKFIEHYD